MKNKPDQTATQKPPKGYPQTFDEFYKMCKNIMIHGTKKQTSKLWKIMRKGKGDWIWARAGIIAEAYDSADSKGKKVLFNDYRTTS